MIRKDVKMNIQLAYFYHDLCNLYGDSGNVLILAHLLRQQGINVSVDRLTVDEPKKIENYDWIYIGSATERGLLIALMDLRKYRTELSYAIEHGTHILATGNSFELFGQEIRMGKKHYKGLGLLDFSTDYGARIVNDLLIPFPKSPLTGKDFGGKKLVGFENHPGYTTGSREKAFLDTKDRKEGVVKNHFIGTYTIGPLLVRNPFLLAEYAESLIFRKDPDFQIKPWDLHLADASYAASLKELEQHFG